MKMLFNREFEINKLLLCKQTNKQTNEVQIFLLVY